MNLYTCPMHPEVVRGEPGNCPGCGMALIPSFAKATAGKLVFRCSGIHSLQFLFQILHLALKRCFALVQINFQLG